MINWKGLSGVCGKLNAYVNINLSSAKIKDCVLTTNFLRQTIAVSDELRLLLILNVKRNQF
jgi:hypothetical protein